MYTNTQPVDKETKKNCLISSIRFLKIKLSKSWDTSTRKNLKIVITEIEKDMRRWKESSVHRPENDCIAFSATPIFITALFFMKIQKSISKFHIKEHADLTQAP